MGNRTVYEDFLSRPKGPHFRLITLFPSQTKDALITCELNTHPLSHHHDYEALSYCWGDANDTRPIQCNGTTFSVTSNLEAALLRLRRPDAPRVLWVDAVCINQSNLAERASQVGQMRTIYRNAARVLVWLGRREDKSELAFPLCERIAKKWFVLVNGTGGPEGKNCVINEVEEAWARTALVANYPRLKELWGQECEKTGRTAFEELLKGPQEVPSGGLLTFDITRDDGTKATATVAHVQIEEFLAFMKLIRRAWWTRSWVVQEICLAKEALVICGDDSVDWNVFATSILIINWESNNPMISLLSYDYALSLIKLITTFKLMDTPMDLLDMLRQFRSLQATDPRDKVHAFLGLMPDDDPVHQLIRPNYEIDIAKCYIYAARTCMDLRQNLDLLVVEQYPSAGLASTLPSWVPDWSFSDPHISPLPLKVPQFGKEELQPFTASGSSSSFVTPADDSATNILALSGIMIDTLEALEAPLPAQDEVYGGFFDGREDEFDFKTFQKIFSNVGAYYDTLMKWEKFATGPPPAADGSPSTPTEKERLLREFCITLCAGNMARGPDETYQSFLQWRADLKWPKKLAKLDRLLGRRWMPRSLYHWLVGYTGINTKQPAEAAGQEVYISRIQVAGSRRLARTANGRLALVPKHAQSGDQVVLCRGGKLPLILRSASDGKSWELVGCAYVRGIMYGEAWKEARCQVIRLS